jgi:hypothetical protein
MRVIDKIAESKFSGFALQKLEQLAVKMGVDEQELFHLYLRTKNNATRKSFADIAYGERVLLLPQCLRSKECPAQLKELGYVCQACGRCVLKNLIHLAKTLGYKGVFILPGGSLAKKILQKVKPKACLGVACFKELVMGSFLCEKVGVIGQGVALARDGCVNTIIDWVTISEAIRLQTN